MSLSTIRAGIKTGLDAISGIEKINDFVIWSDEWDTLINYFVKDGRANTWQIGLSGITSPVIDGGIKTTGYNFNLYGFYTINTTDASSKTFEDLCAAIVNYFSTGYNPISVSHTVVSTFPSLVSFENSVFMDHPVHRAVISMTITETVAQDSGACNQ